ncbi:MAG: BON domain-containing protein [Bdellovibrionales bacterium]
MGELKKIEIFLLSLFIFVLAAVSHSYAEAASNGQSVDSGNGGRSSNANSGADKIDPAMNETDSIIVERIRQEILNEPTLSVTALNVEIESSNGKVTVRGLVESPEDKMIVIEKAKSVAGAQNVTDEVMIRSE